MLNHCLELKIKCRSKQQKTIAVCRAKKKKKKKTCSVYGKNKQEYQTKKRKYFQIQDSEEYTLRYGNISRAGP